MEAYFRYGGLPPKYQCEIVKNWTYEEWLAEGEVHFGMGIASALYGIIGVAMYIPCCKVLLSPDLWDITVYKYLFIVSIFQIFNLIQNSIFAGVFFSMGIVFCNYPHLNYIVGSTVMMAWSGVCCTCFILGLSRLVDLWSPKWHDNLFGGARVIYSVVFILLYSSCFLFYASPTAFNSRMMTWHFDPMVYPDGSHITDYASYITVLNNEGTVSLTFLLTITFTATFVYKSYFYHFKMTKSQKQIFVQTCISSMNNLASATIYVSYSFIDGGRLLNYLGLLTWQLSSCGELVMFLFINKTVRDRVLVLLRIRRATVYVEPTNGSKLFSGSGHI